MNLQSDQSEAPAKVISAGGTWTSFTQPSVLAWGTEASGDNQKSDVISMKPSPTSLCGLTAPSFVLLSNIPLSGCTSLFMHSPTDGPLDCFWILSIMM